MTATNFTHSVCATIYTYNRMDYARNTIQALAQHLYTTYPLHLHIADDGSDGDSARELAEWARRYTDQWESVDLSIVDRKGYGGSYNQATQYTHLIADMHLAIEDDWELMRPFDLDPLVAVLVAAGGAYDCIRLGYLGWTQELRCALVRLHGQAFLALDPQSAEPHVWAGHPRLETRARQRRVGEWPEHVGAGATEMIVSSMPESRRGVLWPCDLIGPIGGLFAHTGAIQARDD